MGVDRLRGWRMRAPIVRIADHGESTTVIGPRGALRFDDDSAALLRAVLEIHGTPVTREQLFAALAVRTGGDVPAQPVEDLVAILEREGVLVAAQAPGGAARVYGAALPRRIVLGISGAIAAVDAPVLVRGLHALGCDVRIALTKTAQRFVAIAALEALTHHQVWRGLWQRDERVPVPHINLAEWAELVLVWPASATTLARIASGDCSDLVSAIATATRAPVLVAPSMNDAMWASAAVQHNLETLRAHGRWLAHPTLGHEVAHAPEERRPMFGPAAPPAAMLELVRHLLVDVHPRPRLPVGDAAWERLWSTTPDAELPWHADTLEAPLAAALDLLRGAARSGEAPLDARGGAGKRLLDLGTGAGLVAIEAARRGFRVTATDLAASALRRARERAGALPILFVLDDITATRLDGPFDVTVDVGLLHCLPHDARAAYAAAVTALTAPGGTLLLVAHQGPEMATYPVTADDVRALLPAFELVAVQPTTLAHAGACLFELVRLQAA